MATRLAAAPGWRDWLPQGRELPAEDWARRHRAVTVLAWAHVGFVGAFALAMGFALDHAALEATAVALLAALATQPRGGRSLRSVAGALSLLMASGVLVHLSGGTIEVHFHFFVMLAVIALYQAWTPFLVSVGFVVLEHGVVGALDPASVYNHPGAVANPWLWAGVHGGFVLAASLASLATWRLSEGWALRVHSSEERLRTVLTGAPIVLFATDTRGAITLVEGSGLASLGLRPGQVLGRTPAELFPDRPEFSANIHRALAGETFETSAAFALVTFDVRLAPLRDPEGHVTGVIGVASDATERLRAQAQRVEVERLRAMDAFKTTFINTAAHELGTPLTPIRIQLHLLKKSAGEDPDERRRHAVEVLDRNVRRLAVLLKDVLDGARLQSGQLRVRRVSVDLRDVLAEAQALYQEHAAARGVRLEMDAPEGLRVEADADRLAQVLSNFLSNAVKFTPRGGWVRVEAARVGGLAEVVVRDSGSGIVAEDLARLFQPFSQVHDPMQQTDAGTGLGLYISKGIVEQHGGRIWARSEGAGRGSTFGFALPLEAVPPRHAEGNGRSQSAATP